MSVQFSLGLNKTDGKIYHISEVENGIACNCKCPVCGTDLIAKNRGQIVEYHFQHANSQDCTHGYETALHLLAKQIIAEEKKIKIPCDKLEINPTNNIDPEVVKRYKKEIIFFEERYLNVDEVKLENRVDDIIPDIIVDIAGKKIFIEIIVSNPLTEEKIQKVKNLNYSLLAIDLSELPRDITKTKLKNIIVDNIDCKRWIYIKYKRERIEVEISTLNEQCRDKEMDYINYYRQYEDGITPECPKNNYKPVRVDSCCGTCKYYQGIRLFGEKNVIVCLFSS